jgi:RES domain-containing protein
LIRAAAELARVITIAPTVSLKRIVVRLIPRDWLERRRPPDFLFTSRKPGRFNEAGVRCVYFSEGDTTAEVEYLRLWAGTPAEHQPRVTYFARLRLRRVIDLTRADTLSAFELTTTYLHRSWRLATSPTATQALGAAVSRQARVTAIRYPADASYAAGAEGVNVVVFRESVRSPDRVEILGPGKDPLQSWP